MINSANGRSAGVEVTIDVAQEIYARRWRSTGTGGEIAIDGPELLPLGAAGSSVVGHGLGLRIATLAGADDSITGAVDRALLAASAEVTAAIRTTDGLSFGERSKLLREARPDIAIILTDRRQGDAVAEMCEAFRAGCGSQRPAPRVLVSGDPKAVLAVHGLLQGWNSEVLPSPSRVDGQAALIGRLRELRRGTAEHLILRDDALECLARALARGAERPALILDVTGSSTSIVLASPGGVVASVHSATMGVGHGADRVVERVGLDGVRRWIPWSVDAPTLLERVFNRARWPDAVPADPLSLAIEIALAHEALAALLKEGRRVEFSAADLRDAGLVALTGRLADLPRPGQALLAALNAFRPSAMTSVVRDSGDGMIALGGLAHCLAVSGGDGVGAIAAEVGRRRQPVAFVVPLEGAATTLRFEFGGASRDERITRGSFYSLAAQGEVHVSGVGSKLRGSGVAGECGVVVDARESRLALPPRDAERLPTVAAWFAALDATPGSTS